MTFFRDFPGESENARAHKFPHHGQSHTSEKLHFEHVGKLFEELLGKNIWVR
jgi:hypothetical protein